MSFLNPAPHVAIRSHSPRPLAAEAKLFSAEETEETPVWRESEKSSSSSDVVLEISCCARFSPSCCSSFVVVIVVVDSENLFERFVGVFRCAGRSCVASEEEHTLAPAARSLENCVIGAQLSTLWPSRQVRHGHKISFGVFSMQYSRFDGCFNFGENVLKNGCSTGNVLLHFTLIIPTKKIF